MKQCFTYIDKRQNKTNFNSGQQSRMESEPLPTPDTRQLVYTHPSYALVEEHESPQGPETVRCHMMHTHKRIKEYPLSLRQEKSFQHMDISTSEVVRSF